MRYTQEFGKILNKTEIAKGTFDVILHSPEIAKIAAVGQFVNILCDGFTLRRPISLCGFNSEKGILRIVFEVRGKGTEWMSRLQVGDDMDIIGPLGHGFGLLDSSKKAVIVGGGVGTPPLLPVAQFYRENATVITGFRNASASILQDDFAQAGTNYILCTDDGSAGIHGLTTQALEQYLNKNTCDIIYTCGPKVMMHGVARLAEEHKINCQVSMEERMGCGVGACLCCVCPTKDDNGNHLTRVCLNGPVFMSTEVDWDA
ncbi:MAG: dihydroorotate dehydrogenase electron transfer subunit [Oscillospiraceae bacterium]|nr:dihydroorotate dehydrogenase electron transfer subunit [Oscillospiraceae bacterium]MDD4413732.1 dihydroorotate dehydrogenase electron transfer subunit [Oscillospiraceae bacterium]